MPNPLVPSQEAREAAADWCERQPFPSKQIEAPSIRAGEYDHHSLAQAFARFEQAIRRDEAEQCAQYHDRMADEAEASWEEARKEGVDFFHRGQQVAAKHRGYATALRARHADERATIAKEN